LVELDELFAEARNSHLPQKALSLMTPPHAAYGRLRGAIRLDNRGRTFDARFRLGASFTGLGPQKFVTRRMVWSVFPGEGGHEAFEARALQLDDEADHQIARVLQASRWSDCNLREMRIDIPSSLNLPERISASADHPDGSQLSITGQPGTFVILSRPGPDGTRLHTLMGFAEFRNGDSKGAGMYEFSRRVGQAPGADESD
jgi:hypothetical protein